MYMCMCMCRQLYLDDFALAYLELERLVRFSVAVKFLMEKQRRGTYYVYVYMYIYMYMYSVHAQVDHVTVM